MLECIFCDKYKTAIKFDMEVHLYEKHRWELLRQFPLKEKGYTMDFRIEYFINQIKIRREKLEQIKNIQATAQAMATDMKELMKSTTINDKLESPDDRDY